MFSLFMNGIFLSAHIFHNIVFTSFALCFKESSRVTRPEIHRVVEFVQRFVAVSASERAISSADLSVHKSFVPA